MFPKKKKLKMSYLFIAGGIVLAVLALATLLCSIVISDNIAECSSEELNLGADLFGCTTDKKYVYDHLYFVTGNTANSPKPTLSKTVRRYIINSSVAKNADIKIISAASAHEKIKFSNKELESDSDNIKEIAKAANKKISDISLAISKSPTSSGAEYLGAIIKAGNKLINDEEKGEKSLIIVIGSGISDKGVLDFTKGKWDQFSAEETRSRLVASKQIISDKLDGVSLYWSGIGDVVMPQEPLSEDEKNSLQELYEEVLEELGVNVIGFEEASDEGDSVETKYGVEPISVRGPECIWCGSGRELSSDMIGFNENGTSFSDEEKAKHNLESLISEMKRNINETVTITGFVSTVSHSCNDDRIDNALAENRAARIKQLLIDNGISADRIKAVSGGKGQKANECEGGTYNADLAKSNMYVKIRAEM